MDIVGIRNAATYGSTRRMSPAGTGAQTAGATSAVNGATIDRFALNNPRSAEMAVCFDSTLAQAKTLSFALTVQDSADGATWATFAASSAPATISGAISGCQAAYTADTPTLPPTAVAVLAATGGTGGSTQQGTLTVPVGFAGARRYVRLVVTPTLSATTADTVTFVASGFFAGSDRNPFPV